ncbi:hypothetical protein K437DRAFT_292900 [Tilletiaria anomala UBC 951]|uniref:CCHC-type domain-containing protein n=1 Tax=Tilletiaria anomala (strain ATCC 24038 / CBS 436.72 / UBC 951) TaxID=1037660 RepID=A0A066WJ68_TILAU|nr:uncharacterized protein K437DRAFT_292900 [Tilletiaria anomala UBC 951]KDN52608.1 hypothetical protein K437DRAFT_292900 [Tilletiaria anomala UBC 951]
MTRYTKLDSRKPSALPASDHFGDAKQKQSDNEPDTTAASETLSTASAAGAAKIAQPAPPNASSASASSSAQDQDPTKLYKRSKLLKLKAKKAKSNEKRTELLKQAKALDQMMNAANGARGGKDGMGNSKSMSGGSNAGGPREMKRRKIDTGVSSCGTEVPETTSENPWKKMERERRQVKDSRNEVRREKRAAEREAKTRCFACRGAGHAAKDCPNRFNAEAQALDAVSIQEDDGIRVLTDGGDELKSAKAAMTGAQAVGLCFRCGSQAHTLSSCRRPPPRVGSALPFATCFVCSKQGHLASTCPQNKGRGVYPNGGCCVLCSSVEHLAKDCALRREGHAGGTAAVTLISSTKEAGSIALGADEDDFHALARRKQEVEKEIAHEAEANGGKSKKKGSKRKRVAEADVETAPNRPGIGNAVLGVRRPASAPTKAGAGSRKVVTF